MKSSGGNWNKKGVLKCLLAAVLLCTAIFGFVGPNKIITTVRNFFEGEETVPNLTQNDIHKGLTTNNDGTYELSLDVTGRAIKKVNKANVIVIVDTSSSMNTRSGSSSVSYTPTNSNGNNLYGLVNGEYVPLHRWNGWSGYTYHDNEYYYNWVNNNNPGTRYTGQRYLREEANQRRIEAAKSAVTSLAEALLGKNTSASDDTIEMALITFDNEARVDQDPTNIKDTFLDSIDDIPSPVPDGRGTNWEGALQKANDIDFGTDDKDPTFVIFVSDGSPTFRYTRGDYSNIENSPSYNYRETYYDHYGVYGTGTEADTTVERCYDHAKDDAKALVDKGMSFYAISAYGTEASNGRVKSLASDAGAPNNYYEASNTAKLQEALNEILEQIELSGIGEVQIEDGTTENVTLGSTTHELLKVDQTSYKYWLSFPVNDPDVAYKNITVSGNTATWTDSKGTHTLTGTVEDGIFTTEWKKGETNELTGAEPPEAKDENGSVKWDLSEFTPLLNKVTYKVTFDVYPSQETYDLIADLKNGTVSYSELEKDPALCTGDCKYAGLSQYIGEDYRLRTNTTAKVTYVNSTISDDEQTVEYKNPDPVVTDSELISVHKNWDNQLDDRQNEKVTMNLIRDDETFLTFDLDGEVDASGWETSAWTATGINIATGLARLDKATGTLQVLEVKKYIQ